MKYKVQEVPNEQMEIFHVNEQICEESYSMIRRPGTLGYSSSLFDKESKTNDDREKLTYLVSALLAILGVTEVSLYKYEVRIEKAELFDWSDIEANVAHVLKSMVATNGVLEEMPRTICTAADRRRAKAEAERYEREWGSSFDRFPSFDDEDGLDDDHHTY